MLTVLRGLLVGPLLWFMLEGETWWALALFLLGVATDILDGWAARREKRVTLLGQLLDPFVDKVFYLGMFSVLTVLGRVPILALVLFFIPQAGLGVGTLVLWHRRGEFAAAWPGKLAASLSALAAGLLLLSERWAWVFWVAVAAQFLAASYYLYRQSRRRTPAVEGPETPATPRSRGG